MSDHRARSLLSIGAGIGQRLKMLAARALSYFPQSTSGDVVQAIYQPMVIGMVIVAVFFGALGWWAASAPLTAGAMASGIVSPDGSRRTIQHLEGGIIRTFLVSEGDFVEAGQELVALEDTQARASFELVRGQHLMISAMLVRLTAEQAGAPSIIWPEELVHERDRPQVTQMLLAQENMFQTRKVNKDNQRKILRQRIAQLEEEISGTSALVESETRQLDLIEEEVIGVRRMVNKGLERKPRLLNLQRSQAEIEGSRASNLAQIARSKQAIGEAEIQIMNLEAQHLDEIAEQLTQTRVELSGLEERMLAAGDVFERVIIRSPIAGIAMNKRFSTVGGVVRPGDAVIDVVPVDEDLLIDARIAPIDIDVVSPGLEAQVHFSAFAQRNLPQIQGVVRSVAADAAEDEKTGERYYKARIEVDRSHLEEMASSADMDLTLHPGMPAEVLIVTGENTLIGYLLEPLTDSLRRSFK